VEVVKQFSAELKIQLASELADAVLYFLGLLLDVCRAVKADFLHHSIPLRVYFNHENDVFYASEDERTIISSRRGR
jgi:hypothetical protein